MPIEAFCPRTTGKMGGHQNRIRCVCGHRRKSFLDIRIVTRLFTAERYFHHDRDQRHPDSELPLVQNELLRKSVLQKRSGHTEANVAHCCGWTRPCEFRLFRQRFLQVRSLRNISAVPSRPRNQKLDQKQLRPSDRATRLWNSLNLEVFSGKIGRRGHGLSGF